MVKRNPLGLYQRASALISALFIMTLVAIAATAMGTRLQLDIYRTKLTLYTDELYLASQSVTFWAMNELSSKRPLNRLLDEPGKVLAFPKKLQTIYPPFSLDGGLYDLQSLFNINNISDKKYLPTLFKLLAGPNIDLSLAERKNLVEALQNWITPYQPGRGKDALLGHYLKQKPPYFPSHLLFQSPSEIRLVRGFNATNYRHFSQRITTLPQLTPVNVNTASKELLLALSNGLSQEEIDSLLQKRAEKPIRKLEEIQNVIDKTGIIKEQIGFESQYFLSVARVSYEDLGLIQYSILMREKDKKGNYQVYLVNESLNTL